MTTLYLIVDLEGTRVALPAAGIRSVMTSKSIVAVAQAPAHFAGLAAMRSEVITVIDPLAAVRGEGANVADEAMLVAIEIDGHVYGLAVTDVVDTIEIDGGPRRTGADLTGGWRRVATGVVEVEGDWVLALDPVRLIDIIDRAAA